MFMMTRPVVATTLAHWPTSTAHHSHPDEQGSFSGKAEMICRRLAIVSAVVAAAAVATMLLLGEEGQHAVELRLMRFFRDLSRYKSRQRLAAKEGQVVDASFFSVVLGTEEALPVGDADDDALRMTAEELRQYDGSDESLPLYLSIKGRIYDVTAGREYYGPGRSYHHFVGRDATRAYVTGCSAGDCLVSSLVGIDKGLQREVDRWIELYEYHDKYTFVGLLIEDPVAGVLERSMIEEKLLLDKNGQPKTAGDLRELGKEAYKVGMFVEANMYWRGALVRLGEAQAATGDELPEEEVFRASVLGFLASAAQKDKDYAGAVETYQEALDILGSVLSPVALAVSDLRANVAADQAAALFVAGTGKGERVLAGFAVAVDVFAERERRRLDAEPRMEHANTLMNYARAAIRLGRARDARDRLVELVDRFSAAEGQVVEALVKSAKEGVQALDEQIQRTSAEA